MAALLCLWAVPAQCGPDALAVCDDIADPFTLDPHRAWDNKSYNIISQIFEGLLRFDDDGKIEPALASECRQIDPLTLRCRLREGVVFHDGEPLDAQAVAWSISRQIDPRTGFPVVMELSSIREARVAGPHVVEILTSRPDGLLRHRLAGFVKIVPPGYFAEAGPERFAQSPVGTGPFRFVGWEKGKAIELAANEGYWEKGFPKIKRVTFVFADEARQIPLLFDGRLDLVTEIPATKTLEVAKNPGTRILKRLVLTTPAFWFTSFEGPLGDRRVRQALNLAVNKELLIRYAVLGNGQAIATLSMRGEAGHNEELKPYPYSPGKARALLAQAGYPKGFPLTLLSTEQASRESKILAGQWKKIGVETRLTILPLGDVHKIMVDKRRGFSISANLAPSPTAHMYFLPGVCWHSQSFFSRLRSPEFDGMYERLFATLDPAEHLELAKRLDAWIFEEALGVFTYQKIRTYALNRRLEIRIPVTGMLNLREAYWKP